MRKVFYWCPKCQKLYPKLIAERQINFRCIETLKYHLFNEFDLEEINKTLEENGIESDIMYINCPKGHKITYIGVGNGAIDEEDIEIALEDYRVIFNPETGEVLELGRKVPNLSLEEIKQLLAQVV
jgi:hypothetical protein